MAKAADKVFEKAGDVADGAALPAAAAAQGPDESQAADEIRLDFPCSVAQERFWLLDRLDPGASAYNVAVRWRLEGRIATDLLELAWVKIIERHEVLRTVFPEVNGAPLQRVIPRASFRLHEIDLSNLAPEQQQTEGDRIGVIEARAPFDLATGPLIRAMLLRFSANSSIILVTTHQIVSDGWSIGVMAREMGVIYDALRHDKRIDLEPLSIQYADYSEWQLEWLKVRGNAVETAYWAKQLAGIKPFKVPPDHARPSMPTTNGAIASRVFPRELTNRAQAMSAERGATLFAAAFAALCATLARFTNETEIVVGTQVSSRDQVELESMVGQFVNSLILRNDLGGNPTFGAIVDGVRETVAQALEHRHIPIETLLGMVKSERSDANTPPISVNFIFQKTFIQNTSYTDFALIDMPSLPTGAIYDLNLFMVERPDGWRFSCQYNTDQFERATADRLLSYIEKLLDSGVRDPSLRLSDLALSAPEEARQLLASVNDTRTLYPRDLSLTQLFEAQSERAPDAVAMVCGERRFTFAELNAAADRCCAYLKQQGVAAGSMVGVSLALSGELPVCILAILKAGATYVPLEPKDPPARRAYMIRASGMTAIIGQRLQRSAADGGATLIDVEAALAHDSGGLQPRSSAPLNGDSIACTIFNPGVDDAARRINISHRNLTNLIYSLVKRLGAADRDVLVGTSPPSTSRSVVELFLPLITGARLVVPLDEELADGRPLLHLLQRSGATMMYGSADVWRGLLEANWIGYPALKMLCSATELDSRLVDRLTAIGGEVWSLYGLPEAGTWSTARLLRSKEPSGDLGRPLANTSLHLLGASLRPTPIGAVGQLYVGGDGLTESALARSIHGESSVRLYPTGSLARLRSDGRIEYLGRMDDRFMHRGVLVDPVEIEQALLAQPLVAEAAVAKVLESSTEGTLQAFIVLRSAAADAAAEPVNRGELAAELRRALAQQFSESLVPAAIDVLEALPRRPDGALDRRSLQTTRVRTKREGEERHRPSGETEVRLAAIWASMLGIEAVSADDNFFEHGGHSLLAARMLTRVEREFGRRIKLATLFLAPTLREFCKVLAQTDLREFDFRQVVKIQSNGSKRPLIAINNTGIYYGLAKNLGAEQPVYSLQLFDPSVRDSSLPDTLEDIAAGYVALIRRVRPQGPYDLMGWCVAGALAFEIARQLQDAGQTVSSLFLIDSWVPGYFKRQPVLRGVIGNYTMRAQLILADWRRVWSSQMSISKFFAQRTLYRRLQQLVRGADAPAAASHEEKQSSPETYDQWLLAYLQRVTHRYQPKPYPGRVTLLRSRLEPTGLFFQEDAGWGAFAPAGVDIRFVDGNHFTMFQDPGSGQMAAHVAEALTASSARG